MFPEIIQQVMCCPITNIGQLSTENVKILNLYVKKGILSKGKGGGYPTLKTVYAYPEFDFNLDRKIQLEKMGISYAN